MSGPTPWTEEPTRRGGVVVVGGALMDLLAHSRQPLVPGTSNPARLHTTPGGVGRNIAENLARLGTQVALVAVVGPDPFGDRILQEAAEVGIDTSEVVTGPEPTGTYLAVLDVFGELYVALSDLTGTEALTVARIEPALARVAAADLVVVDGNLPLPVTAWLLDRAAEAGVPVVLEPVSVAKAARLAGVLRADRPVLAVTPNSDELCALTSSPDPPVPPGPELPYAGQAAELHRLGIQHVWVRRGAAGSVVLAADGSRTEVPPTPASVVDVTGAGDAMTAGFVHALATRGASVQEAAAYGQVCAALTVASPHTVRPDLTDALVRRHLQEYP